MHLKRQGLFVCRTLSFQGCNFNIVEEAVSDEQLAIYDQATELWIELHQQLQRGINGKAMFYSIDGILLYEEENIYGFLLR